MQHEISFFVSTSQTKIALAACSLLVVSTAYAFLARYIRNRDPDHGLTAVLVVFGVGIIAIAYTAVTSLALGALLLSFCAIAGAPMVWEYTDHRLSLAERARRAVLLTSITGDNDALHTQDGRLQLEKNGYHRNP